jgi:hypothetical protein
MQRVVNRTIEEEVLSVGPPRDYASSPVVNKKSVIEREREEGEGEGEGGEGGEGEGGEGE